MPNSTKILTTDITTLSDADLAWFYLDTCQWGRLLNDADDATLDAQKASGIDLGITFQVVVEMRAAMVAKEDACQVEIFTRHPELGEDLGSMQSPMTKFIEQLGGETHERWLGPNAE